jgi:hypothetical protein
MRCAAGAVILALCLGPLLGGCRSEPRGEDPLTDIKNPRLSERQRVEAIERVWADAAAGRIDRTAAREDLKTVAWSASWPLSMRMAALKAITSDTSPEGSQDTRAMARLMLPREPDAEVVRFLSELAAGGGWQEVTPALVRSLSRRSSIPDKQRAEYGAIQRLNPAQPVERVVYGVFIEPPREEPAFGVVPAEKVRADAWDLLTRLDVGGAIRAELINSGEAVGPIVDMRAALRDLRTLPLSGDEMIWLTSLRDQRDPRNGAWWQETASTIAKLDARVTTRLQLRHLEPIRWAGVHRPEWLNASREELLKEVRGRLEGRTFHRRTRREHDRIKPQPERLADWEAHLTWADLLSILVIDEGLRPEDLRRALFAQADMDREDKTAEYGGLLRTGAGAKPGAAAGFSVALFPPRPGTRQGDDQFVASTDMIAQSNHALAHYHFHVQSPRNAEYAGPSPNDLAYAARFGRNCLVFTSVSSDAMDVDYYQPDGVTLDLGEIRRP